MECLFTTRANSVHLDVRIKYNDLEEPLKFSYFSKQNFLWSKSLLESIRHFFKGMSIYKPVFTVYWEHVHETIWEDIQYFVPGLCCISKTWKDW